MAAQFTLPHFLHFDSSILHCHYYCVFPNSENTTRKCHFGEDQNAAEAAHHCHAYTGTALFLCVSVVVVNV